MKVVMNENKKHKSIPFSMWRCIKDGVSTLIDTKVGDEIKRDIGRLLIRNIELLDKQQNSNNDHSNDNDDFAGLKTYLNELRGQVFDAVEKILTIAHKANVSDERKEDFWERVTLLEEKITIMDNVNCNFRKILKLENDFLRDLLKVDRETMKRLQKKLTNLQTKLNSMDSTSTSDDSNTTCETVIENQLKPTNQNQNTAVQAVPKAPIERVTPVHQSDFENSNSLMECVIDLISRGLSKEEILKLFRCIRSYRETSDH